MKRVYVISIAAAVVLTTCSFPEYKGEALWTYEVSGHLGSTALGNDGTIYFTVDYVSDTFNVDSASLVALNPDGSLKWSRTEKYDAGTYNGMGALSIGSDGTLYIAGKLLYALSPEDSVLWMYEPEQYIYQILVGADGTLYILVNRTLCAVTGEGQLLWKSPLNLWRLYGVTSDGTVYAAEIDNTFSNIAVNADGSLKWRYDRGTSSNCQYAAIGEDGSTYCSGFALKPDGSLKWKYAGMYEPSLGTDDNVCSGSYIEENKRGIITLDTSGNLLWEYEIPGKSYVSGLNPPAIGADGTIYIGEYYISMGIGSDPGVVPHDYYLYAVDKTGKSLWKYNTDGQAAGSPLIAPDGTLYLWSETYLSELGYKLHAIKTESMGLAASSWPRPGHDNRNTGCVQ